MLGADMLFRAIGLNDEAAAEIKALLDPAKIKATFAQVGAEFRAIRKDAADTLEELRRVHARLDAIEQRACNAELIAQGGAVAHPRLAHEMNLLTQQVIDDHFRSQGDERDGSSDHGGTLNGNAD